MRKVSDLVKFRNSLITKLDNLSPHESLDNAIQQLELVVTENYQIDKFLAHDKINYSIDEYQKLILQLLPIEEFAKSIMIDIDEKIDQTVAELNFKFNHQQGVSFQGFRLDPIASQLIFDKMQKYADWSYPGLRLGCRYVGQHKINFDDTVTQQDNDLSIQLSNHLVANDPLYFCDFKESLITDVTQQFNPIYANRIRKYVISDHDLSALPQKQFGFIFGWWVFNFADLLTVENYLKSIFNLLRSGGTFMFSYNNSDLVESARLVDMNMMSHVPYRHLTKLCQEIGFKIDSQHDIPNTDTLIQTISWLEIKKPGELKTVKLKQVIGTIGQK